MSWRATELKNKWKDRKSMEKEDALDLIHLALEGIIASKKNSDVEVPRGLSIRKIEAYAESKGIKISYADAFEAFDLYEDLDAWVSSSWSC